MRINIVRDIESHEDYTTASADARLIASALAHVAQALHWLGTADASTPMGAIELLAKEVKGVAESLDVAAVVLQK